MKTISVAMVALSLINSSTPEEQAREVLLDSIERSIQLPKGAQPLSAYARYYAAPENGEIVGIYMLPGLDELPPGEGCEQLSLDGPSTPCSFEWPRSTKLGAGNRTWLPSHSQLPMPMRETGDCGVVSMVYDVSSQRLIEVVCFGQGGGH